MSAISRTAFTTLKAGVASVAILGAGWVMVESAPAITEAVPASTELGPARTEQAFRYQSRVTNTLLDHYPLLENFAKVDPRLVAAEGRHERCLQPLDASRAEPMRPETSCRCR